MGKCGNSIEGYSKQLNGIRESIVLRKQEYEEKCELHLELKTPMLEEYEKLRKKKDGALKVITQRSVDNSGVMSKNVKNIWKAPSWNTAAFPESWISISAAWVILLLPGRIPESGPCED